MTISKEVTTSIFRIQNTRFYLGRLHYLHPICYVSCTHKLSTLWFYPNAYELSAHGSRSPTILELPHPTFKQSSLSTQTTVQQGDGANVWRHYFASAVLSVCLSFNKQIFIVFARLFSQLLLSQHNYLKLPSVSHRATANIFVISSFILQLVYLLIK